MPFDILIKNGHVADGTGNPWFRADVGIEGEEISAVGSLEGSDAQSVINADELVVAPGFIDIHSHCDFVYPLKRHPAILEPKIRQGITTEVVGNCGFSPAPVNNATLHLVKSYTSFLSPQGLAWNWSSFGDYLDILNKQGVAMNVVPLVGHGAIRTAVMGLDARQATNEELEQMKRLTGEAMEDGACGMSTGLIYSPGQYADTDELVELCKVVAKYGGIYTTHYRGEGPTLESAVKELIRIGEEAGIPVEQSHHTATGRDHWSKIRKTVDMIEEARARGVDVTYDIIPYTSANSTMLAVFPPWSLEGGVEKLIQRLNDPVIQKKIRRDIEDAVPGWPPWLPGAWPHNLIGLIGWESASVVWCKSEKNKGLEGKTIPEIAKMRGVDPFDAVAQLVTEEKGDILAFYVGFNGDQKNDEATRYLMKQRLASICTDSILIGEGKLGARDYGCFPRVLGHYVREERVIPLEDAVRKMTSLPAQRVGLRDRGMIRQGAKADITIFDHARIKDKDPLIDADPFPEGIEYVLINGKIVTEKGKYHGDLLAGQVIRRTARGT